MVQYQPINMTSRSYTSHVHFLSFMHSRNVYHSGIPYHNPHKKRNMKFFPFCISLFHYFSSHMIQYTRILEIHTSKLFHWFCAIQDFIFFRQSGPRDTQLFNPLPFYKYFITFPVSATVSPSSTSSYLVLHSVVRQTGEPSTSCHYLHT